MKATSVVERLNAKLVARANGCIEWTGYTSPTGYGTISVKGKMIPTHRLVWELAGVTIPDGMKSLHRCDNPPCCNIDHLFLGTQADNVADMLAKGRWSNGRSEKTHCPAGHEYDEANTYKWRGSRHCKACGVLSHRRRAAQDKATK